jgi:uncharacterized protein (UPF0276 family)
MTPSAGIGFKADHLADALTVSAEGMWFEVHAENYMVDGGPRLAVLDTLAARFPLSIHGVGMSLASPEAPDPDHLDALKRLVDRTRPALVSEHLAWSRFNGRYYPDLLPMPRTTCLLIQLTSNIAAVQDRLDRAILIENPSHYLDLADHDWGETDFLVELCRRAGCGLLVDVNNVVVGSHNLGFSAEDWLAALPGALIGEIHLAGHSADEHLPLLIDSHDAPIGARVWQMFERLVARVGPRPTLIERDANIPPFAELMAERNRAQAVLEREPAYA